MGGWMAIEWASASEQMTGWRILRAVMTVIDWVGRELEVGGEHGWMESGQGEGEEKILQRKVEA